jgi:hypothetical protein
MRLHEMRQPAGDGKVDEGNGGTATTPHPPAPSPELQEKGGTATGVAVEMASISAAGGRRAGRP